MPARTGQSYIDALNNSSRDVQVHGDRVEKDIADHPAFRNVVRTYAQLFDMQHDARHKDTMTYESPTSGERVGMSFLQPKTIEDLERRRSMIKTWSDYSLGQLGRTGDYLNSSIMAMASAADWFGQVDKQFADNIRNYYDYVRENDLLLTHTLINPQSNRSKPPNEQSDPFLAAGIVEENDEGIVIRGARMLATIGPIADEIMVFPSTVLQNRPEDEPYSYAFAIPCDTPGLRFLCRESFDYGRSHYDHPLGSRFDEVDAVAIFDDVLVPYERCFMIRHPELLTRGRLYNETDALVHMTHQVVIKDLAKTEFVLGLVSTIADAIKIEQFQHVQEKIGEIVIALETLKSFLRTAEVDAETNKWGLMTPKWAPLNAARNWFPKQYPQFIESIWKLSASGLFGLPTEADGSGDARGDVDKYLACASMDGVERVKLFRLAWDASVSSFAGRQEVYEHYFFGDPVRMVGLLVASYDRSEYMDRIAAFLKRED